MIYCSKNMIYQSPYYIYLISLLFASICSVYRFKKIDIAAKILSILVCSAFINESAAYYLAIKYHNNISLYAIYCLLEFSQLCLYFNNIIDVFRKNNIGIFIGVAGILLGIINILYIQHLHVLNTYFLFFEDLMVIGMSLFAFFRLLIKNDSLYLFQYPHFWFISILAFFWSITFLNWGLYDYINLKLRNTAWQVNFALPVIGIITYSSLGCVYLWYPVKTKNK